VWVPTQDGEAALAAVVEASGLPVVKCDVHKVNIGGACGRRIFQDYLHQAVRIARQIPGTPVKLLWSREEDIIHGRYHPIMKCKLVGAFDKDSRLTGLHIRLSGQSIIAGHPGIADLIAPGVAFGAIHGRKKLLANDCRFPIVWPGFSVSTHGWLEGRFAPLLLTSSS
jgi:xanthine dehydrogenase molybdopterin-binding subunit B